LRISTLLDDAYKDVQAGGLEEIGYGRFRNPAVELE
jgi:hypothetical protein